MRALLFQRDAIFGLPLYAWLIAIMLECLIFAAIIM